MITADASIGLVEIQGQRPDEESWWSPGFKFKGADVSIQASPFHESTWDTETVGWTHVEVGIKDGTDEFFEDFPWDVDPYIQGGDWVVFFNVPFSELVMYFFMSEEWLDVKPTD